VARPAAVRGFHSTSPVDQKEEPLGPSLTEKYKLTEPTRYVPLTIAGFSFGSLTGLYHFDAESQLLALWVLFCGTVYSRGGPLIAEALDDIKHQIAAETHKLEDAEIDALKVALSAHKRQVSVYDDITGLFSGQGECIKKIVSTAESRLVHQVRDEFVRKLDSVVLMEEKASDDTRKALVDGAAKSVRNTFSTEAGVNLKVNAMAAALEVLGNPQGAKKDTTVSSLYSAYFKSFAKKVADAKTKEVTLSPEALKEIKETVEGIARRDDYDSSKIQYPNKIVLGNF